MKPPISIAMATYNGSKYIQEQLESFLSQTYQPFELVVCDDCSTDNTVSIINEFSERCNFPVRVYVNDRNLGFSGNFLKCASLCTAEWISFSDQDDVWLPEKLSIVASLISSSQNEDLVLVTHSAILANESLHSTGRKTPDYPEYKSVTQYKNYGFICIPGFTITFRAEILDCINCNHRPRDYFDQSNPPMSHDKWIPLLANIFGKIVYLPDTLAVYRRHDSALSGSYNTQSRKDRIKKSLSVGFNFYNFQASAASQCADSLKVVAGEVTHSYRRAALLQGANKYSRLSHICKLRSEIYKSNSRIKKIKLITHLLFSGGYFGKKFTSYGYAAFAKDLFCSIKL